MKEMAMGRNSCYAAFRRVIHWREQELGRYLQNDLTMTKMLDLGVRLLWTRVVKRLEGPSRPETQAPIIMSVTRNRRHDVVFEAVLLRSGTEDVQEN